MSTAPRDLAIYVHWPYCAKICPYCDFNVYRAGREDTGPLLDAILADMRAWRQRTGARPVTSIFFGGGTPSLMAPADVARLIGHVSELWGLAANAEISLEANPTDAEAARFQGLADAGVERLSLGLQALDDVSLKTLGRFHSAEEGLRAATLARAVFPRLSVDLIYARHAQSLPAWEQELAQVLQIGCDHISPYQLTIEDGTAYQRAVQRGIIRPPEAELGAQFYLATQEVLQQAGFEAYEVSNHARAPAARSRHNLAYWTSQDWVGVGPGAHGRLGFGAGRIATTAQRKPAAYVSAVREAGWGVDELEELSLDAARSEFWLMGLRLADGIDTRLAPGAPLNPDAIASGIAAGHVWQRGLQLGLTPAGRLLADRVIGDLILA